MSLRKSLIRDQRGTTLIEFAILLPVLLTLYLGVYQLCDAGACKRRVTVTSRAMADLVSQYSTISTSELDTLLSASAQVMAPYPVTNASIRVTQVTNNGYGYPTVSWSRAQNGTALKQGDYFNLPAAMRFAGVSVIYAEVTYSYTPLVTSITGPMTFTQSIYMLPRTSNSVVLKS